jgi:hypothetical protein
MKLRRGIQKHTRIMHINFFGDPMSSFGDLRGAHMGTLGEYGYKKPMFFIFHQYYFFFLFLIAKYDKQENI